MDMVRIGPSPELTMPIGEAMFSQRAIRRLDPDRPVSDEHLKILLDAASKAPNGGNEQPARYLVIRDRAQIAPRSLRDHAEIAPGTVASMPLP